MQDKQNMARETAIEVKDVSKVYKLYDKLRDRMKEAFGIGHASHKLHYALSGVNMNIYRGETVGIIGTNGSGKSTITNMITGIHTVTSGEMFLEGHHRRSVPDLGRGEGKRQNLRPAGTGCGL